MFNQTADEIYLLNTIDRWRNLIDNQEDYEDIHTANAQDYMSSLNPIFLSAFKNLESLNNFSFIQSRDGIMDLIHFFNLYREPHNTLTKILIRRSFSHIVPNSWLPNIIFYTDTVTTKIDRNIDTFVYVSAFRNSSINEENLQKIANDYNIKRLFICGEALPKKSDIFHSEVSTCERIFNLKSKYLSYKDIFSFSEKNSIVYEDQYSNIMFSKSFLSRILIINGILPINYEYQQVDVFKDSPHSGIKIADIEKREFDPLEIYQWLDENNREYKLSDYYEQLNNVNNTRRFYFDSAYQFSKSLLENKNIFYR
ncbi:hypothetical protein [Halobacteriovorax sp. JY17]|uniref:hypothetical protein n=1 Tax=Halobacteriovorax sp. JY17 TaxID=2014617 RepID=UPI000C479AB6|nr:hypothetical protein [Halobacteriovorax sp. JY17]PIK14026.1 MAG: hypothetical protein CES88_13665 [Halobacteriovorax sp. JY17]